MEYIKIEKQQNSRKATFVKKLFNFLFLILILYYANKLIIHSEYHSLPQVPLPKDKKAIVVGATSGIGRQVAKELARDGYEVGLIGRRVKLLESLQKEISTETYIKQIDVSNVEQAKKQLEDFIAQLGRLDLIFISLSAQGDIGAMSSTVHMDWQDVKKFIDVDLNGFWVTAHVALEQFKKQGHGHLVGVSSVLKYQGAIAAPEYSGAKAFIGRYLDGIRNRMMKRKLPIYVTEVIPGPVDVERQKYSDVKGLFWVTNKEDAAKQIAQAIKHKRKDVYISRRWRLIAWVMMVMPDWLYRKFFS